MPGKTAAPPPKTAAAKGGPSPVRAVGIAIVEGDARLRSALKFALDRAGGPIIEAASAQELAGKAGGKAPEVVFVGPSPSGADSFETLRALAADERFLDSLLAYLGGGKVKTEGSDALNAGARFLVMPPFTPEDAAARLAAFLGTRRAIDLKLDKVLRLQRHGALVDAESERLKLWEPGNKTLDALVQKRLRKGVASDVEVLKQAVLDLNQLLHDLVDAGMLPEDADLAKVAAEREKARDKDPKLRRADPDDVDKAIATRGKLDRERQKVKDVRDGLDQGTLSGEQLKELIKAHHRKRKQWNRTRQKKLLDEIMALLKSCVLPEELVSTFRAHGVEYEAFYAAVAFHLELKDKRERLERMKAAADQQREKNREVRGFLFKQVVERQTDIFRVQRLDQTINVGQNLVKDATRLVEKEFWELYRRAAVSYRRIVVEQKKDNLWLKLFLRFAFVTADSRVCPKGMVQLLATALRKSIAENLQREPGDPRVEFFDAYLCAIETGTPSRTGLSPGMLDAASVGQKEAEQMERAEDKWRRVRVCSKEKAALDKVSAQHEAESKDLEEQIMKLQNKQAAGSITENEAAVLRRSKGNLNVLTKTMENLRKMLAAKNEEMQDALDTLATEPVKFKEEDVVAREVEMLRIRTRQCGSNSFPLDLVRTIQPKYLLYSRQLLLNAIRKVEGRTTRLCQRYICVNYKETGFTYRDGPCFVIGLPAMANMAVCVMPKDTREEGRIFMPGQCEAAKLLPVIARGVGECMFQANPGYHPEEVKSYKDPDEKDREKKKLRAMMSNNCLQEDFRMWLSYARAKQRRNVGNEKASGEQLEKKPVMEFMKRYLRYIKKTLDAKMKVTWDYDLRLQVIFENYLE